MTFTRSITKNTKLVLILYYRKGNTTIERSDFAQYYGLEPKANEEKLKILEWRHCHFFSVETFIEKKMVDTIDELHVEKLLAKSLPCFYISSRCPMVQSQSRVHLRTGKFSLKLPYYLQGGHF